MVYIPNVCMCGWNCKHVLCCLYTVRIPFATNQNLSVFCSNTKEIARTMQTWVFMFVNCTLVVCVFYIFSIWAGQRSWGTQKLWFFTHGHIISFFIKHQTTKARYSPRHTIVITENGIFFSTYCSFGHVFFADLVANNFFKTVNTNLKTYENSVFIL